MKKNKTLEEISELETRLNKIQSYCERKIYKKIGLIDQFTEFKNNLEKKIEKQINLEFKNKSKSEQELLWELAARIVKLQDEIDLAINALRIYAKSNEPDLAKETLIKLQASL
jgi:uncharacterized protein YktA (UPF0223 family)